MILRCGKNRKILFNKEKLLGRWTVYYNEYFENTNNHYIKKGGKSYHSRITRL